MQKTIAALTLAIVCGVTSVFAAEREWSKSAVMAVAEKEAKRLGYDVKRMNASLDPENSKWKEYLEFLGRPGQEIKPSGGEWRLMSPEEVDSGLKHMMEGLEDRTYWAVYFSPRKLVLDGDLWVFIDRKTGDIIKTIPADPDADLVRSIESIPPDVMRVLQTVMQDTAIANPDQEFNASDVVRDPKLPWRRLIFAKIWPRYAVVFYEHGGYAPSNCVLMLQRDEQETRLIGAGVAAEPVPTMKELLRLIETGRFREVDLKEAKGYF